MGCGMRVRLLGRTMLGFWLSGGKCLVCGLVSYDCFGSGDSQGHTHVNTECYFSSNAALD